MCTYFYIAAPKPRTTPMPQDSTSATGTKESTIRRTQKETVTVPSTKPVVAGSKSKGSGMNAQILGGIIAGVVLILIILIIVIVWYRRKNNTSKME